MRTRILSSLTRLGLGRTQRGVTPRRNFHNSPPPQTDVTTFTTKHTPEQLQKMGKDDFFANVRRPFLPTETRKAIGKALSEQNPPSESQMRRLNRIVDNPSIFSGKNDAAKTALSNSGMSHIQRQYELSLIQQEPPNLGRRLLNRLNG